MARIRTIKPEFWLSEDMASVSESSRLLAIALLNQADDQGYFRANPALIKAAAFPLTEPSMSIHDSLVELSRIKYIRVFDAEEGKQYGLVCKFTEHQRINRPTASKIKDLDTFIECSLSTHPQLTGGKERKGTGKGKEQGKDICSASATDALSLLYELNRLTNSNYKAVESNLKLIRARLAEHSVDELKQMIEYKACEWLSDEKMEKYLRPATLFNAEKCNQYVGQMWKPLPKSKQDEIDDWINEGTEGGIIDVN